MRLPGVVVGQSQAPTKSDDRLWPIVDWVGWGLILTDPTTIQKVNGPSATSHSIAQTVANQTPIKMEIPLKLTSSTTIPAGYESCDPNDSRNVEFMTKPEVGPHHSIYREFNSDTSKYRVHFELEDQGDMTPAEAILFAETILRFAVPMQEDELVRAAAAKPDCPSWAETACFDEETGAWSGRGPSIQLKDGHQKWDIHSNWFEGGDEQFTLSKRYKNLSDPTETPDEYFSFSSRNEVISVMAGLVNLLATISEDAK